MAEELGTIWVCQNCMLHHANGECGDCHRENDEHEGFYPWNSLSENETVTMGMAEEEHSCGRENGEEVHECDCETNPFGTSRCEGCYSWFHGERHAFTLWSEVTYKVIRFFRDSSRRFTVKTGLTKAEAQEHCNDPETSSSTCTNAEGKRRTAQSGPWFDGWTEE